MRHIGSRRSFLQRRVAEFAFNHCSFLWRKFVDGPNTVSESTASNTELSELLVPHRVPGAELSEILSGYSLCAKANSPSMSENSPSLPQNSVSSLFRNSTLETVIRPFPMSWQAYLEITLLSRFRLCVLESEELEGFDGTLVFNVLNCHICLVSECKGICSEKLERGVAFPSLCQLDSPKSWV